MKMRLASSPVPCQQEGDHLPDRRRLAAVPRRVAGLKPVEAARHVVGSLLFGRQHGEAQCIRQRAPARTMIIGSRSLAAAMEHHNQGRRFGQRKRNMDMHAQPARIGAEIGDLGQAIRRRARRAGAQASGRRQFRQSHGGPRFALQ